MNKRSKKKFLAKGRYRKYHSKTYLIIDDWRRRLHQEVVSGRNKTVLLVDPNNPDNTIFYMDKMWLGKGRMIVNGKEING